MNKNLTSELSLEDGALLLLPAVSLVGTTVICCIGMLLFPGNAPAAAATASLLTTPSAFPGRSPSSDRRNLLSHPPAASGFSLSVYFHPTLKLPSHPWCRPPSPPHPLAGGCALSGDGTGSGHRGNGDQAAAPETLGCEVLADKWDTSSSRCAPPSRPPPPPPSAPPPPTGLQLGAGDCRDGG